MADLTDGRRRQFRLGVDIGGTFTDATLIDEGTGEWRIAKSPSTPSEPAKGFMAAVDRVVAEAGLTPTNVRLLVHGSTVATNAIIEGKAASTAFVTTRGFRDMLEIARQMRPTLYDLQFQKPRPLVPRRRAFEVNERMGPAGEIVEPLDEASVRDVAAALRATGVEAVAICLLHSYANPDHERRVAAILAEELPGVLDLGIGRRFPRDPRVLPGQHNGRERRGAADRRPLPRHRSGSSWTPPSSTRSPS